MGTTESCFLFNLNKSFLWGLFVGLAFVIGFFLYKNDSKTFRSQAFNLSFRYPRKAIVTYHEDLEQKVFNGQISSEFIYSANLDTTYRILIVGEKSDIKNTEGRIKGWVNYPSTRYGQKINYEGISINGLKAYRLRAESNDENFKESVLIITPSYVYTFYLYEPPESRSGELMLKKILRSINILDEN